MAGRGRDARRGGLARRHAVRDRAAYDRARAGRGDITVWVSPEAVAGWHPAAGRRTSSDAAIAAAVAVHTVFRLALRQAEGLIASTFALLGLALPVPDRTTLSRRGRALRLDRRADAGRGIDLAIDSTGPQPMTRAFVAALAALAHPAAAAEASAATLVIRVEGVRSNQGLIYAGVCATGFGDKDCPYRSREAASVGTVELRIRNVEPGEYAVAVFQDLNGNGRIDRPFFIPTEPYGFSNDAGRRGGVPRFEAAKVSVRGPTTTVVVPLR